MNIGYLIPEFPGQTHIFFMREILFLREEGETIYVISSRKPKDDSCPHISLLNEAQKTHYIYPPGFIPSLLTLLLRPIKSMKALFYVLGLKESSFIGRLKILILVLCAADLLNYSKNKQINHIHVHSCANSAHIAALTNILGGPTYSLTLHGDLPVYGKDHKSKMKRASFIAAVTSLLKKEIIEEVGIGKEKVPVIWMGVDTNKFNDIGQHEYAGNNLHIVTVGRLNRGKGHIYALKAVKDLLNKGIRVEYSIVGEGPLRGNIEKNIKTLKLLEVVKVLGALSEDKVIKLLQRADVFVLPSVGLGEAAPVSVMEAMSCGMPVICSIIGGTSDMIQNGVDGFLVEQEDEKKIVEILVNLAWDTDFRRRIGKKARERAIEFFNIERTSRNLLNEIKKTIN